MRKSRGLTLIELMIAMVVLAIVTAIALPSYNAYIQRARVPAALDGLSAYATRMEQRYQDTGSYANAGGGCGVAWPAAPQNFSMACAITNAGQGFTATATGSDVMSGYTYTIDHNGTRRTTSHPKGTPAAACWSTKGTVCDA